MSKRTLGVMPLLFVFGMILGVASSPGASRRLQIEVYGGLALFSPKDLNLFSRAEEQYNELFFIQRLRYLGGHFVNDLPEMNWSKPFGLHLRYWMNPRLALSLGIEGFSESRTASFEGTFGYSGDVTERYTKGYDPYRLSLQGFLITGGLGYRFPVGQNTDIEVGAAAGYCRAAFEFSSAWTYDAEYQDNYTRFFSQDGGTLEGDGIGGGLVGQVSARLSRSLNRSLGFFIETGARYCRLTSLEGEGKESRVNIPGQSAWNGEWGIKKEDIRLTWSEDTVYVPTNYWEGWTAGLRDRDFILDLSSLRLVLGIYLRF